MTRSTTTPATQAPRGTDQRQRTGFQDNPHHDPYQAKTKVREPAVCTGCGALFHRGRWTRDAAPEGASAVECPACHRIRDRQPAGYVTLSGALTDDTRAELVRLVRNVEKHEGREHPLNRIMAIEQDADRVLVTTTDTHLPQRIGEALRHAHQGQLEIVYAHDEYTVRVTWRK
jgi:NMD protein affecting ribosome stability and mRNA decay